MNHHYIDNTFTKYITALDDRAQDHHVNYTASVGEYKCDHLQNLLYHLTHTVPGVAEYLQRETMTLHELNQLERI